MIYACIAIAAFATGIGFTVAATIGLIWSHRSAEAAARLYAAHDEAIALTLPGALGKAVDIDPHGDLTYQAMCFEAREGELS